MLPTFGDRDPATVTAADVQEWIAGLALKPASIHRYLATLRAILDFVTAAARRWVGCLMT